MMPTEAICDPTATRHAAFRIATQPPTPEDWQRLAPRLDPHLQLHGGLDLEAWGRHLLPPSQYAGPLLWLVARDSSDGVIAALPLVRLRGLGSALLVLGGYYWPYRGVPAARGHPLLPQAMAVLVDRLRAPFAPRLGVRLGPVRVGDETIALLLTTMKQRGWRIGVQPMGRTFHLPLPATSAEFDRARKSLLRRIEYYKRRIAKDGTVSIRTHAMTSANCDALCRILGQIERESWLGASGDLHFATAADLAFWRQLCTQSDTASRLVAHILYLNDVPISFSFNIDSHDRRMILANLYADTAKGLSPGWILAHHVIRDAIDRGLAMIDWGTGDSGYKGKWGALPADQLVDVMATPPGLVGWASSLAFRRRYDFDRTST
jgi:CelD/BcsL family acetyltransferase involved in cellulose biosynthesis